MVEVDLLSYLPPFIREYDEIQKIAAAEKPEFQEIWVDKDSLKNDLFILSATDEGLKRFENIAGVHPNENDTLDLRRQRVLTRWNERMPFTFAVLKQILEQMCGGEGFYTVSLDNENYTLRIRISVSAKNSLDAIRLMMERVVPANIIIDLGIRLNTYKRLGDFTHRTLGEYTHEQLCNVDLE